MDPAASHAKCWHAGCYLLRFLDMRVVYDESSTLLSSRIVRIGVIAQDCANILDHDVGFEFPRRDCLSWQGSSSLYPVPQNVLIMKSMKKTTAQPCGKTRGSFSGMFGIMQEAAVSGEAGKRFASPTKARAPSHQKIEGWS